MPVLDVYSIGAYMFGLFLIYIFAWVFVKPLRWLLRFTLNSLFGGVLLVIINAFGGFAGITMGVNLVTAAVVGFGGVPAVVGLFIVRFMTGG